jgi:hypothetical protein
VLLISVARTLHFVPDTSADPSAPGDRRNARMFINAALIALEVIIWYSFGREIEPAEEKTSEGLVTHFAVVAKDRSIEKTFD